MLLSCRTKFINYFNVILIFCSFYAGLFCISNLARLYSVRRLKPLPHYRRATAKPNSFEFGTHDVWNSPKRQHLEANGPVKRCVLGEQIAKNIRFPFIGQSEFLDVVLESGILT